MSQIPRIETIEQIHQIAGTGNPLHPLVTVINYSNVDLSGFEFEKAQIGFYAILWKDKVPMNIRYGRELYDFQKGTRSFFIVL